MAMMTILKVAVLLQGQLFKTRDNTKSQMHIDRIDLRLCEEKYEEFHSKRRPTSLKKRKRKLQDTYSYKMIAGMKVVYTIECEDPVPCI